jgi:integrase
MSTLRQSLSDSLALRHAMGFQLHDAHTLLPHCIAYLEQHRAPFITAEWAVRWATQPHQVQPAEWARRLRLVRGFAQYHSAIDPRTEVPPPPLLPYHPQRHAPYLYSQAEIARRLQAARHLPSPTGLRAGTYTTVFGLLAVTGMRISELVTRNREDVDLRAALLPGHVKVRDTSWDLSATPELLDLATQRLEQAHRRRPL